ncbi:MAG TPA: FeoA domain-containing protein [Anaerolineales bacterium]|nr:FeoA domain-containing protein [Anaerolineales bacterium]
MNSLLLGLLIFATGAAIGIWLGRRTSSGRVGRLIPARDDALKHIYAFHERGLAASPESIAGALGLSLKAAGELVAGLEDGGWVEPHAGGVRLTTTGEQRAAAVVRAHRLWERYLVDEAGWPVTDVHRAADATEHGLADESLEALEASLGHPRFDPHGDPIPSASGLPTEAPGIPLADWPVGVPAHIVHLEDEPADVFRRMVKRGVTVNIDIEVLRRDEHGLQARLPSGEINLSLSESSSVHVDARPVAWRRPTDSIRLSELPHLARGTITAIDPALRGLTRRRLLDFGLTPGARIEVELANVFGDPRGYRVRGTLVALRSQQARHVYVRRSASDGGSGTFQ